MSAEFKNQVIPFKGHVITAYLEYVNDFLTVERFSEYYGISVNFARATIEEGRKLLQEYIDNNMTVKEGK